MSTKYLRFKTTNIIKRKERVGIGRLFTYMYVLTSHDLFKISALDRFLIASHLLHIQIPEVPLSDAERQILENSIN
jgi:hypothetical protein